MTIDEAIMQARKKAKEQRYYANFEKNNLMLQSCLKCAEEYEQIAEWLEDYKRIKMLIPIEQAFKAEYNKAIDDAKSVILQTLDNEILVNTLHLRLEQLKEGANNGADNQ